MPLASPGCAPPRRSRGPPGNPNLGDARVVAADPFRVRQPTAIVAGDGPGHFYGKPIYDH